MSYLWPSGEFCVKKIQNYPVVNILWYSLVDILGPPCKYSTLGRDWCRPTPYSSFSLAHKQTLLPYITNIKAASDDNTCSITTAAFIMILVTSFRSRKRFRGHQPKNMRTQVWGRGGAEKGTRFFVSAVWVTVTHSIVCETCIFYMKMVSGFHWLSFCSTLKVASVGKLGCTDMKAQWQRHSEIQAAVQTAGQ